MLFIHHSSFFLKASMSTIDIVILIVLTIGVVMGLMKGFIRQLAALLGLVVGLLAAKALYAGLAERISPMLNDSMTVAQIISFVGIWVAVPLVFALLASALTKLLKAVSLGWLDSLLGAGLGLLKYALLTSLLICVVEYVDSDDALIGKTLKQDSALYYPMKSFAGMFFPVIKQVMNESDNPDSYYNI